jgi:hypothetical protein
MPTGINPGFFVHCLKRDMFGGVEIDRTSEYRWINLWMPSGFFEVLFHFWDKFSG